MPSLHEQEVYDVAIAGGGLAGLALSIQLAGKGYRVILFEKEQYPFHKVCGEYISMESWDFLQRIGSGLNEKNVAMISQLQVSAINGKLLERKLPLGGFGISRYKLDQMMAEAARSAGVIIQENTKVNDIVFANNEFTIEAAGHYYRAKVACGSFGKRSNIDVKWKRSFVTSVRNKLNNYIGVKYHIQTGFPVDTIALHNFRNGYCGIVKIEEDKYNLCYLTTADNLQTANGSIAVMEQTILWKNPHLKKIWEESKLLFTSPLTISQISFDKKTQVENHVLMIGDAAGMITPLCGNGMSMALHGSVLAAEQIDKFLSGYIGRETMEGEYIKKWQQHFAKRLKAGRLIQGLFERPWLNNTFINIARHFPLIADYFIRQTHGRPF